MATRKDTLVRRASRVRRQVKAVANGRLRLSVHRSSKNIYAQVIDDVAGKTVASASTLDTDLRSSLKTGADTAAAAAVGKLLAGCSAYLVAGGTVTVSVFSEQTNGSGGVGPCNQTDLDT